MTLPKFKVMGHWLTPRQIWFNWCIDNYLFLHSWRCWFGHKWEVCSPLHETPEYEICVNCLEFREIERRKA